MTDLSASRLLAVATSLLAIGTIGFHGIDGMIEEDAGGSRWINAFYCAVVTLTTVGYGDICPSDKMTPIGRMFVVVLTFCGLGMFCGPIMDYSASWKERIPGGALGPGLFALGFGTLLFVQIEEMEWHSAIYFVFVTGTTVGYGELGPKTDRGRVATAVFAVLAVNVVGGMLEPAKRLLSVLCTKPPTKHKPNESAAERKKRRRKRKKKKKQ